MIQKAIQQHRRIIGHFHRIADVARQVGVGIDHFHRAAAQHVARAHHQRVTNFARQRQRFVGVARGAVGRLQQAEFLDELLEAFAVFGQIDRIGRCADHRHAVGFQRLREFQRGLAAVLHDHALRLFQLDDFQHVFQGQRFEIQAIRGVVIGGHGFRVAVDHDGLVPVFAQRQRRVYAAVIELDALPDPVRAAAQHDDLVARTRRGLAFVLVGRIQISGISGELGSAGIHALVDRAHAEGLAQRAHRGFVGAGELGQARVGETAALERAQTLGIQTFEARSGDFALAGDQFFDLVEEPWVDERQRVHVFHRHAGAESVGEIEHAFRAGFLHFATQAGHAFVGAQVEVGPVEADLAGFQTAQRLLQRFLECAADRHHLAHGFHLRGQPRVSGREFLEREARNLGDDVIDAGLERRGGEAAGDFVLQFIQRVADRELGCDLGDRETSGL